MDYINSYVRAKEFFLVEFVPKRKEVIQSLKKRRDEIQKETKYQKIGCTAFSTGGVLSGGATLISLLAGPMTAGVSTVLTVAYFGGMSSGVADITQRCLKWASIRKSVGKAVSTLEAHETTFSNLMPTFLLRLSEDIKTIKEKIETIKMIKCDEEKEILAILENLKFLGILINIPQNPEKFLNILSDKTDLLFHLLLSDSLVCRGLSLAAKHIAYSGAKKIAKEGVKESAKDFTKACAYASVVVSIGLDLKSLYFSVKDLSRFSAGELCDEAEQLNSVITKMEYELKYLHNWFEEMSNE